MYNNITATVTKMFKALVRSSQFLFARFKEPNLNVGFLGEEPDVKGMELDTFRRFYTRAHLGHAGKPMPNFEAQADDLPTVERNEVAGVLFRLKPES